MAYLEYKIMTSGDCENTERTHGNKQQPQKEHSRSRNKSKERKIMASGPITSWQIDEERVADFIFLDSKSLQMVTAAMKLKDTYSLEGKL